MKRVRVFHHRIISPSVEVVGYLAEGAGQIQLFILRVRQFLKSTNPVVVEEPDGAAVRNRTFRRPETQELKATQATSQRNFNTRRWGLKGSLFAVSVYKIG